MQALDLVDDRGELRILSGKDSIRPVVADTRLVRRNTDDPALVNPIELKPVLRGSAGHAGELFVKAIITLISDLGGMLGGLGYGHALLDLNSLMHAVAPMAVGLGTARRLVHQDDFVVANHVMLIAAITMMRPQR